MDNTTRQRPAKVTDRSRKRSQRGINRFARFVLGSPVHRMMSGKLMIIEVIGRRTGTLYAVPTAYADHDGQVLAASAGTWLRNIAADRPVVVVHRGRRRMMRPEVAVERERALEIATWLLPGNPVLRSNMGVQLGPDGRPDQEQFDAARAQGVTFLAFHPEGAAG